MWIFLDFLKVGFFNIIKYKSHLMKIDNGAQDVIYTFAYIEHAYKISRLNDEETQCCIKNERLIMVILIK